MGEHRKRLRPKWDESEQVGPFLRGCSIEIVLCFVFPRASQEMLWKSWRFLSVDNDTSRELHFSARPCALSINFSSRLTNDGIYYFRAQRFYAVLLQMFPGVIDPCGQNWMKEFQEMSVYIELCIVLL